MSNATWKKKKCRSNNSALFVPIANVWGLITSRWPLLVCSTRCEPNAGGHVDAAELAEGWEGNWDQPFTVYILASSFNLQPKWQSCNLHTHEESMNSCFSNEAWIHPASSRVAQHSIPGSCIPTFHWPPSEPSPAPLLAPEEDAGKDLYQMILATFKVLRGRTDPQPAPPRVTTGWATFLN